MWVFDFSMKKKKNLFNKTNWWQHELRQWQSFGKREAEEIVEKSGLRHWGEVLREAGGPPDDSGIHNTFTLPLVPRMPRKGTSGYGGSRVCPAISKEEAGGSLQSPGLFPFLAPFFLVTLSFQKRLQIDTEPLTPTAGPLPILPPWGIPSMRGNTGYF